MSSETSHYRRYQGYDYSRGASFFITFSTAPRHPWFGEVHDAKVVYTPLGEAVVEAVRRIPEFNPGIVLHNFVVMPDHVHVNLWLAPGLDKPLERLGVAIRGVKRHATILFREQVHDPLAKLWQPGYHDHLCVSRAFIEAVVRYIEGNPLKWEMQKNHPAFLRIREPLFSSRLDAADYWRGVGNTALLDPGRKLVSVRVSRRCDAAIRTAAVRRLSAAIDQGYTLLSGFTSFGEKLVRDLAVARSDAAFIVALPSRMPNGYRPDSRYLEPIHEGRCLIIARGNEEIAFGRDACLDLNDEIAKIACAGQGLATYWRPEAQNPRIIVRR